jgi:hypothetical protein
MSTSRPQQRPHEINQQSSTAVRPPIPRDGSKDMECWKPGQLPKGGFRAIIPMGVNKYDTKRSPTQGAGKKVY